jgi:hypothetical protein
MMSKRGVDVARIACRLTRPDAVVNVQTDIDQTVHRVRYSGDRRLKTAALDADIEAALAKYQRISREIAEVVGAPVVDVDGGSPVDVANIAAQLRQLLPPND